ncbi:hypothetical protein R1sor_022637 [Riccia sorocarpa]|uniref:SCP domain-containing protein n=1 Tax=Riccia sorocarpa TaxID=122646 RepID=A0ABD3GM68_9MARC
MSSPNFCSVIGFGVLVSMIGLSNVNVVGAQTISQQFLDPHNAARSSISGANIPNLVWDKKLQSYAQSWAHNQASTANNCDLKHSGGPYGENIYWASWSSTPSDAVNAWVAEKQYYNYATNTCATDQVCGHYTQVIWKKTSRVGCASATCPGGGTFTVCSYYTPGNYIGQKPY